MIGLFSKLKFYIFAISGAVIGGLALMLRFKNKEVEELKSEIEQKSAELHQKRQEIKEEQKKAFIELNDTKENLKAVKEFQAIDKEIQEEMTTKKGLKDEKKSNNNNDTFSFDV